MTVTEFQKLRVAARDPAVNYFLLLPLACLHLWGRGSSEGGVFSLVERFFSAFGSASFYAFLFFFVGTFFWALGRVSQKQLSWGGGAALSLMEGVFWGLLLGWFFPLCYSLAHETAFPWVVQVQSSESALVQLSIASGAGLYEELLFRLLLMGVLFSVLSTIFQRVHTRQFARGLSFLLALLISSAIFSLAHAWGNPDALSTAPFLFRFFGGCALGLLYAWRGITVVAYAHATFDAKILLF
jgi:membrane protease YdiL (CAAX protease family)